MYKKLFKENIMSNKYILLFLISLLFISCAKEEKIAFIKPSMQIPKKPVIVKKRKGSLYASKGASLFSDKKDLQIGDILQVNINEALNSKTKSKRELSSARNSNLGGGLFSSTNENIRKSGFVNKVTDKLNSNFGVDFKTTSTSSSKGNVSSQLDESFKTKLSVIIEEIYQNGNYFIKGIKEILIDGQKQSLILTGVIRPYDISPDNSIPSSQIANLKLLYKKGGTEQDILQVPWGIQILSKFWPF